MQRPENGKRRGFEPLPGQWCAADLLRPCFLGLGFTVFTVLTASKQGLRRLHPGACGGLSPAAGHARFRLPSKGKRKGKGKRKREREKERKGRKIKRRGRPFQLVYPHAQHVLPPPVAVRGAKLHESVLCRTAAPRRRLREDLQLEWLPAMRTCCPCDAYNIDTKHMRSSTAQLAA